MAFQPHIESRNESYRKCNCGEDHDIKTIQGMFYYSEENHVAFCAAMIEHAKEKHVWVSFITGEWPDTGQEDCFVTAHIWANEEGRIMKIENSSASPFENKEIFNCYPVTRKQVLAQDGAKDWFIRTYLALFELDKEIGEYIEQAA